MLLRRFSGSVTIDEAMSPPAMAIPVLRPRLPTADQLGALPGADRPVTRVFRILAASTEQSRRLGMILRWSPTALSVRDPDTPRWSGPYWRALVARPPNAPGVVRRSPSSPPQLRLDCDICLARRRRCNDVDARSGAPAGGCGPGSRRAGGAGGDLGGRCRSMHGDVSTSVRHRRGDRRRGELRRPGHAPRFILMQ